MLTLHRKRDPNGLVKTGVVSINYFSQLLPSPGYIYRIPQAILPKAQTLAEKEYKLASNKIKVIGMILKLTVQSKIQVPSHTFSMATPISFEVFRQAQTEALVNANRYTNNTAHIVQHGPFFAGNPATAQTSYSICSPYNLPLDVPERGYTKLMLRRDYSIPAVSTIQYNSNSLNNAVQQPGIVYVDITSKADCIIDIPDDGNAATLINLDNCAGELLEVVYLSTWNRKLSTAPNTAYNEVFMVGTLQIIFQDIGEKLSHLL